MADVPSGPIPPPPPPPEGTPPGPGSLRPRTLGEILSAAFEIYKNNAQGLIVIVAIIVVPLTLLSSLIVHWVASTSTTTVHTSGNFTYTTTTPSGSGWIGGIIVVAVSLILPALLQAAIVRAAAQGSIGDPVDVESSYQYGLRRFGSVLLVTILYALAVVIGFILLFVPGVIALVFFGVSIPVLVIENKRGTQAMGRSWNLVSGHFWHAFGVLIVTFLIVAVVGGLLGAIGGSNWVLRWIFNAIAQIITAPFSAVVGVLLYLDLRARKEALTPEVLRTELASGM